MMMTIEFSKTPGRSSIQPLRILVAEDQSLVAAEIAGTLRDIGHEVVACVGDGQAAADAVRAGGIDLVLMDINMPGRNGLSAAAEVYKEHQVPVVMLTAYSDRALVEDAQHAGAFGYVIKPADPDQLRVAIDIAYAQARSLRRGETETRELAKKLEDRKVTERAKWIIVQKYGVNETDAWELLQKASRATRSKLADVAVKVMETGELPGAPSVRRRLWNAKRPGDGPETRPPATE
jgi:AmiR/NasT family two-component response regulator